MRKLSIGAAFHAFLFGVGFVMVGAGLCLADDGYLHPTPITVGELIKQQPHNGRYTITDGVIDCKATMQMPSLLSTTYLVTIESTDPSSNPSQAGPNNNQGADYRDNQPEATGLVSDPRIVKKIEAIVGVPKDPTGFQQQPYVDLHPDNPAAYLLHVPITGEILDMRVPKNVYNPNVPYSPPVSMPKDNDVWMKLGGGPFDIMSQRMSLYGIGLIIVAIVGLFGSRLRTLRQLAS